jgi:RNA polymerase sigma factor (sigma-70 family)
LARPSISSFPTRQPQFAAEFDRLILPHLSAAYNLARWLLRSEQDASDVVHDSFLRAHRYFHSFDSEDGKGWLLSIVRNACFDFLRKGAAQPSLHVEREQPSPEEASPERQMMLKQNLQLLRCCIESLPPEYRVVVVLRELEELSYKEISVVAGVAIGTVMSRLNRGRIRLENCLTGKKKGMQA